MILSAPMPFSEALDAHEVKSVLLTTGGTAQLQRLDPAIKRRSIMSATIAIAKPLERLRDGVNAILTGQADQATIRAGMKQLWQDLGYQPDPELAGGLQDLGSTQRINLQIETNVATARGAGWYEQGQQPAVLDEFPAQELIRVSTPKGGADAERDWAERWARAGGEFFGDRMIALKTDKIWEKLGDPELFPDGLGNPWPPFAFNSGMRVRDIDRDEAESLGLIDAKTELMPQPLDLTADLAASPALREEWLRQAIVDSGVGRIDASGVLVFDETGGGRQ